MRWSRSIWTGTTCAYFVAICLGHLQFSLWLVRQRSWDGHSFSLAQFVAWVAVPTAFGLCVWIMRRGWRHPRRSVWFCAWLAWFAAIGLIDRHLTFSLNETAHYPQYMLLAWLIGKVVDPERRGRLIDIVAWTTLAGIADEWLQYLWITTSYSEYLDFNDFLVNQVAAIGGGLIYYARGASGTTCRPSRTLVVVCALLGSGALVGSVGERLVRDPPAQIAPGGWGTNAAGRSALYLQRKPNLYDNLAPGPRQGLYRVLGPEWGLAGLALGMLLTALIQHGLTRHTEPRPSGLPRRDGP